MDKLNSILSVCRSFLQHKPRAEQEKEQSSRESIIVDDVCPDVSIDIFLVTEQIEWKVLTPIMYMNIVQDAFQEAFRDPNNDPWSMAQASTWGAFQDPEGRVFKAVLKQTGQAIGFGSFNFVNLTLAQRKLDVRRSWLVEKKGTEGELLRWWFQEIDNLIDQTLGEKNPVFWNYFKVLPRYRDKGISSQLIQWALEDYSLSEHYVWCSASIDEIQAFKDHGWQEVGFVDIDLSEIKGKSRGYGIHRTYGMVRNPGPLKYKP